MIIKEYRKWINSLPKELDDFELVHREYYDSTDGDNVTKIDVPSIDSPKH